MTYDANPVPVINMTRSGSVNSGVNYLLTTRDFTFTDVEESDAGVYNINADNFAGSAQAVFTLTVTKNDDGESTINCLFMCALVISCMIANRVSTISAACMMVHIAVENSALHIATGHSYAGY